MKRKNPIPCALTRIGTRLVSRRWRQAIACQEKTYAVYAPFFPAAAAPKQKNVVLYRVYRDACASAHHKQFSDHRLRYDLTILPARTLADTYPTRTIGHIHRQIPQQRISYPELYEVLEGTAIFIMENASHTIVRCARVAAGEKIIIPPGDGHITVNASRTTPLVIANIFTTTPDIADYAFFKKNRGPSWEPRWKSGVVTMVKNPRARRGTSCRWVVPKLPAPIAQKNESIYTAFLKQPHAFDFLQNPEQYRPLLTHRALFSTERNASHGR